MEPLAKSLLQAARADFIAALLAGELNVDADGIPSIADKGSAISKGIACAFVARLGQAITAQKASGQTSGKGFEVAVADFLRATFLKLTHLRPGSWAVIHGSQRSEVRISNFQQYHHLLRLAEKTKLDPDLRAALGGDYFIEPDVVIVRHAETDEFLNGGAFLLGKDVADLSPLRIANSSSAPGRLLHATISCKWTLRSDRAQNARTEALNLIRNRNGHVPHIVAITAEPMPKRLASIAQGSSDLDCVYHVALPELRLAVVESMEGRRSEQLEDLDMLIAGKRLRDISDLPLDLAI
jgi:hypothetical protein